MENAIAYIRVSSQRQVDEGSSLDIQTRLVKQFAGSQGWDLIHIFREEGESAKTERRPELQRMLEFCSQKRNRIKVVIIPKIDRLSRNVHDYFNLKMQLSRRGVRLESLGERIEDTPSGRLTEAMFASMAQFDNEVRAERCKGGMLEAVQEGRWVWKAPVGYRNIRQNGRGTIEPDPVLAPVVREAFELFAGGHQRATLVREFLQTQGISLNRASFYRFIQNEVYIGRIHAFGKIVTASAPFVPIVSEELFYHAQARLRQTTPADHRKEAEEFPLRGTIRCECGKCYTAYWATSRSGRKYAYYRCMSCTGRNVRLTKVEADFHEHLSDYVFDASNWERLKRCLVAWEDRRVASDLAQAVTTKAKIAELKQLRETIALKNATGVIPDDLAREQIERISVQIADQTLEATKRPLATSVEELISFAERFLSNLQHTWSTLTLETKKNLLRFMYPDGILYVPNRGFRTQPIGLPEPISRALGSGLYGVVDPEGKISNSLHEWIAELHRIGGG